MQIDQLAQPGVIIIFIQSAVPKVLFKLLFHCIEPVHLYWRA